MSQDHRDTRLDAAYQRASQSEAGRPAASTRAAILEEAAAAARRRAPAANDSRYLWRAVAGLAVIGVAVLVWRQTDVRMPGEAPQMTVAAEVQGDVAAPPLADVATSPPAEAATSPPAEAATSPLAEPAEPPASRRIADAEARAVEAERGSRYVPDPAPAGGAAAPAAPATAPPATPAPATAPPVAPDDAPRRPESQAAADMVLQESAVSGVQREAAASARARPAAPETTTSPVPITAPVTAAPAPPPPPPPPAVQARVAEPRATTPPSIEEATRLLREHFPAQFASDQSHRLWLVRDADGQVLLSGELQPGQSHEDLRPQLRGLQGSTPGPWQVRQLRNDAGQLIELAIAEVELGAPRR